MKAEYRQEIERRESRFIESAGFCRIAPRVGIAATVVSFMGIIALSLSAIPYDFKAIGSLLAFFVGIAGLGLLILGTIPHQITLDMRKAEILDSIASQCDDLASRIEGTIAEKK